MISITKQGVIATITMCRKPANALDLQFLQGFKLELDNIEKDKNIFGVVISSGIQNIFSSGLDLKSFTVSRINTRWLVIRAVYMVHGIIQLIRKSKKIYVGEVSGAVIGSAVSLITACDLRFASAEAWFWLPDPQYGGVLADGGIEMLVGLSGGYAQKLCLSNKRIESDTALKMGLLHELVRKDELDEYARHYLTNMAMYSWKSIQAAKVLLNRPRLRPVPLLVLLSVVSSDEMQNRLRKIFRLGGTHESSG